MSVPFLTGTRPGPPAHAGALAGPAPEGFQLEVLSGAGVPAYYAYARAYIYMYMRMRDLELEAPARAAPGMRNCVSKFAHGVLFTHGDGCTLQLPQIAKRPWCVCAPFGRAPQPVLSNSGTTSGHPSGLEKQTGFGRTFWSDLTAYRPAEAQPQPPQAQASA